VLDPFCGCGTTVEASEKLKRQLIRIDVTHYAVTLIERRLASAGADLATYQVVGRPTDLAGAHDLARRDKHQFQWWASWRLGARWYREERNGNRLAFSPFDYPGRPTASASTSGARDDRHKASAPLTVRPPAVLKDRKALLTNVPNGDSDFTNGRTHRPPRSSYAAQRGGL
jgi:hypothetical protein